MLFLTGNSCFRGLGGYAKGEYPPPRHGTSGNWGLVLTPRHGIQSANCNTFLFENINIMLLFKNSMCVSSSSILYSDMFKFKNNTFYLVYYMILDVMSQWLSVSQGSFNYFQYLQPNNLRYTSNFGLLIIISIRKHKRDDVH